MTYRLAGELSPRIAAIGVVAGSVGVRGPRGRAFTIPEPEHPVSVIVFHGTADKLVPYDGRRSAGMIEVQVCEDDIGNVRTHKSV
jgi:polyhydroxybutyrate depolymerase